MADDPTRRFSSRVADYVKYRPDYPPGVLDVLRRDCGLTPAATVADIGSGTGIFSEMLLRNGNRVFGVEPNPEMRAAAERLLSDYPQFASVDGIAEATTLPAGSVDFVTAAQAFHWFEQGKTRAEFARILRPGGWLVLVWNDRRLDSTPFLRDYEELLRTYGTDYAQVQDRYPDLEQVRRFAGGGEVKLTVLEHRQTFDLEGLRGRLLSSSYAPQAGQPGHEAMLRRLAEIFAERQEDGLVSFDYDTKIYRARLA